MKYEITADDMILTNDGPRNRECNNKRKAIRWARKLCQDGHTSARVYVAGTDTCIAAYARDPNGNGQRIYRCNV